MSKKNYLLVRRNLYKEIYERELAIENLDLSSWSSPYTKLKSYYYIEIGAISVYYLLKTNITPNAITLFYAGLGLIGCVLFAFNTTTAIIAAIIIFFSKSIPDWIDGHIARIQNRSSLVGEILDEWGAYVNLVSFKLGVCIYLSHINYYYLFIGSLILLFDSIDFRKYFFMMTDYSFEKNTIEDTKVNQKKIFTVGNLALLLKKFQYNGQSRYTDIVLFFILVELYTNQVIFSIVFAWIWLILGFAKFLYTLKIMLNKKIK